MMREIVRLVSSRVVTVFHMLAILVITIGIIKAMLMYFKDALFGKNARQAIQESRMELGHSFSLGLGFLIGASILNTTIAPTWNDIGHLASIIAIRTILNYFLMREIAVIEKKNNGEKKNKEKNSGEKTNDEETN